MIRDWGTVIDRVIQNIESERNFFLSLLRSLAIQIPASHVFENISKSLGYDEKIREFIYCMD